MYTATLVMFRLIGKRSVHNMAPFDLIVVIMAGDIAAIALEEPQRTSILQGLAPIAVLGILELGLAITNVYYKNVERVTQGMATIVMQDGQPVPKGMKKEHLSQADLKALLHQKNVDDQTTVQEARLEPTGEMSITLYPEDRPLTQKTLKQVLNQELGRMMEERFAQLAQAGLQKIVEQRRQKDL